MTFTCANCKFPIAVKFICGRQFIMCPWCRFGWELVVKVG